MYSALLMDLDNTILDFSGQEILSFQKIVEAHGLVYTEALFQNYEVINRAMWHQLEQGEVTIDTVLRERFSQFFKQFSIEVDGLEVDEAFRANLSDTPLLMPYAREVLHHFKTLGVPVYSASNGVYKTQMSRLEKADLLQYFDGHFISNHIGFQKPALEFFDYCKQSLGQPLAQNLLMIGDSLTSDIAGANRAQIDSCYYHHVLPETKQSTYAIQDLRELYEIVKK